MRRWLKRLVFGPPSPYHQYLGVDSWGYFTEGDIKRQWPMRRTACARCGDERFMSMFLDPTTVRETGCPGVSRNTREGLT